MPGRRMLGCTLLLALTMVPMRGAAPETFGAGVSLSDVTPIAQVIDRPAEFEGRTVRVEGVVTAVCAHMGCWMALAPDGAADASRTLLLKVDDGVIVFPISARGRRVAAQGVVQRVGSDAEGQSAAAEHARAAGSAPAAPVAWQLKATGAVLH
jgi:hypothetical protein